MPSYPGIETFSSSEPEPSSAAAAMPAAARAASFAPLRICLHTAAIRSTVAFSSATHAEWFSVASSRAFRPQLRKPPESYSALARMSTTIAVESPTHASVHAYDSAWSTRRTPHTAPPWSPRSASSSPIAASTSQKVSCTAVSLSCAGVVPPCARKRESIPSDAAAARAKSLPPWPSKTANAEHASATSSRWKSSPLCDSSFATAYLGTRIGLGARDEERRPEERRDAEARKEELERRSRQL